MSNCFRNFSLPLKSMACQHLLRRSAPSWLFASLPFVPYHRAMARFNHQAEVSFSPCALFLSRVQRSICTRCYIRSRRPAVILYNLQLTYSDLGLALPMRIHISLFVQLNRSTYRSTYARVLHFWLHHYLFNDLKSFEAPEPKSHEQSLHSFKPLAFRGLDG